MVTGIEWDFLASGMYLEWQPCSFSRDELAEPRIHNNQALL